GESWPRPEAVKVTLEPPPSADRRSSCSPSARLARRAQALRARRESRTYTFDMGRGGKGWSRLAAAAGIAAAGALGAAGARRWFLCRPLPPRNETIDLPELEARVEILFDRWGVAHVFAQNENDATFAQGYVHARDRLWQME